MQVVAGAVDGARSRQGQAFNEGAEREADRRQYAVIAAVVRARHRLFRDDIAQAVDDIDVVAGAAVHCVRPGAAVQRVVAVAAGQEIVILAAIECIVAVVAVQRVLAGATFEFVVALIAGNVVVLGVADDVEAVHVSRDEGVDRLDIVGQPEVDRRIDRVVTAVGVFDQGVG